MQKRTKNEAFKIFLKLFFLAIFVNEFKIINAILALIKKYNKKVHFKNILFIY